MHVEHRGLIIFNVKPCNELKRKNQIEIKINFKYGKVFLAFSKRLRGSEFQ